MTKQTKTPKAKTTKAAKIETYGPRSCPLIRSTWLSDEQWAEAKKEFDALMRRRGKKTPWAPPTCPDCGTDKGPFRGLSGRCPKCAKIADKAADAELAALLGGLR